MLRGGRWRLFMWGLVRWDLGLNVHWLRRGADRRGRYMPLTTMGSNRGHRWPILLLGLRYSWTGFGLMVLLGTSVWWLLLRVAPLRLC
jgi:hypothetical protein